MTHIHTSLWALVIISACGGAEPQTTGFGSIGSAATATSPSEGSTSVGTSADDGGLDGGGTPTGGAESGTSAGGDSGGVDDGGASTGAPTGTTVDASTFTSIQDAIDSLEGIGGAVYIPAGEHTIPEKLRVHSNITVFGAGLDVTIIRFEDGAEADHMMSNDSSSGLEHIAIRELTLSGPGPADGINDCCYGLKLEHVSDVLVANVAARNHGRDGFYLGYKHVDDVPAGVLDSRLSGCVATGNGRNGLSIVQGQNILVDGGTFSGNNTRELVSAIDLEPDPYPDGLVTGNRIVGNTVSGNANNGIQLYASGGAVVSSNAVCFNTIEGNAGTGIADTQADADIFVGNSFANNGAEAQYDGSALVGDRYAAACGMPLDGLPPLPPLP